MRIVMRLQIWKFFIDNLSDEHREKLFDHRSFKTRLKPITDKVLSGYDTYVADRKARFGERASIQTLIEWLMANKSEIIKFVITLLLVFIRGEQHGGQTG